MLDRIDKLFHHFSRDFRPADIVEIVLVAFFFYLLLTLVRSSITRRASRNALTAMMLFAGVYVLALVFELYFIERLIEQSFIVFLIAGIVIFQHDLRRMVDRMGTIGLFARSRGDQAAYSVVDVLTEAASHLASTRTGALIAVRGRESWEPHVDGGVRLNGQVNLPLLLSIFDPSSPGHDGAALLDGGRLTCFAAHLPLSSHLPEASRFGGTRHAAALGLSEVTDAFVIVVSEERGTISIAEGGEITTTSSATELRQRLQAFWQEHYERPLRSGPRRRRRVVSAVVSLALAVLFWASFAYQPDVVYRSYQVPIELRNLPPGWVLESPAPVEATITLSGSERAFRLLDPSDLVVSFDLSNVSPGVNELDVSEAALRKPENLRLYDANPEVVQLTARSFDVVQLPVLVRTSGSPPDALRLADAKPEPSSVRVLVPQDVEPPDHIETEPVDVTQVMSTTRVSARLIFPPGVRPGPDQRRKVDVVLLTSDVSENL